MFLMKKLKSVSGQVKAGYALALAMLGASSPALAQGQNQTQVDSMLTSLLNLLTGPIAIAIATIAVVICGFMFMMGNGNKGLLGSVIIGIFIVFGAAWVVSTIAGT